ncbi:MAG TPA: metallophosphoesterase [Bacteroidota bacterium]|nr:metallophosphoesterase [Bacteroidota bacterium]
MRKINFAIFFSVALSVYALINYYIFIREWEAGGHLASWRGIYVAAFLTLSLSYIVGRMMERVAMTWLSDLLVMLGSFWLAAMVYFLLFAFAIDIVRLFNYFFHFLPSSFSVNPEQTKEITSLIVLGIVVIIVAAGYFNARSPRIRKLDLAVHKNGGSLKSLTIAVASDIHLGTIVCKSRLEKIVGIMNSLDPDLVLLPGDVVDEDLGPVIRNNLGETLRKIRSKYGVFAITGNHEYIGGVEPACKYLADHGITMLRDSSVKVAESLYIVGREDISIRGFAGKTRKPLGELMDGLDKSCPVILMDHQPFRLEEAETHGVDLQLSGHTHHGQLWPFNFITKKVYELSWGYKKRGNTHYYVSCGVGTWGPPVRTGNRPEIISIRLEFSTAS